MIEIVYTPTFYGFVVGKPRVRTFVFVFRLRKFAYKEKGVVAIEYSLGPQKLYPSPATKLTESLTSGSYCVEELPSTE